MAGTTGRDFLPDHGPLYDSCKAASLKFDFFRRKEIAKESEKILNDQGRRTFHQGDQVLVPLKFTSIDEPVQTKSQILKAIRSLNQKELIFLKLWRDCQWNEEKANKECGLTHEDAKRVVEKLTPFKHEELTIQALATIPTPDWIAGQHVQNVFEGGLDDSKRDSLKELAKITGSYKQNSPTTQINVFQMPQLSPDQAKAAKEFFDTIAVEASQ